MAEILYLTVISPSERLVGIESLPGGERIAAIATTYGCTVAAGSTLPFGHRLLVDPVALGQRSQALLTILYCSTDRLCRCGAAVKNLSHGASFHSWENNAPSNAGTEHLNDQRKRARAAAEGAVTQKLREQVRDSVLERALIFDPKGRPKIARAERRIYQLMEPFMKQVSYTRDSYRELYAKLPPDRKNTLPKPEDIKVDEFTLMLAEVPGGLEHVIADIHAHSMGYDRRKGNYFEALLNKSGDTSRILFGSIPQYCGGDAHYSTALPNKGTMKKAYKLDGRVVNDWLDLYKKSPAEAAKADLSITGINFANIRPWQAAMWSHQAFRNPVKYMKGLMLRRDNLGLFVGVGEITGIKEMVARQMGNWAWKVDSSKFRDFLSFVNETGQLVLLHNDWGEHSLSATLRPSAAKQNYEHLGLLKFVFSRPEYRRTQIIFAHTGIGRLVRPGDRMIVKDVVVKNWVWDRQTGQGRVKDETVYPKVRAPEHIHRLYELFAAVPNARVDISWNDVTQAYIMPGARDTRLRPLCWPSAPCSRGHSRMER